MEPITDASLKGYVWDQTLEKLVGKFFETQWDVYALCITIGLMYDKQINSEDMETAEGESEPHTIGRTVLVKSQNRDLLEFMFKTALVTTKHLDIEEDERLELAFSDEKKPDFSPIGFLTKYANYGVTVLAKAIEGAEEVEIMEALMTFLNSTYETGADVMADDFVVEDLL